MFTFQQQLGAAIIGVDIEFRVLKMKAAHLVAMACSAGLGAACLLTWLHQLLQGMTLWWYFTGQQ